MPSGTPGQSIIGTNLDVEGDAFISGALTVGTINGSAPGNITSVANADGSITVTNGSGPAVDVKLAHQVTFSYAGNPNTHVTALHVGDLCIDTTDKVLLVATAADNSHWVQVPPNISAGSGITVTPGSGVAATSIAASGTANVTHVKTNIAYNSTHISDGTGFPVYTPTSGYYLLDAWIEVDTVWDGTTPLADIGFSDTVTGIFGTYRAAIDMTAADAALGANYLGGVQSANKNLLLSAQTNTRPIGKFTGTGPVLAWVTQDGTLTGASPSAAQGAGVVHLLVATS